MIGNNFRQSAVVAAWELVIAAGIVVFWAVFFTTGPVAIDDPKLDDIYRAFESAFPAADFALVTVLVSAAIGLLRRRAWGRSLTLVGAGMLVFLGLLDISFNMIQGIYRLGPAEAAGNGAINLISLGSGVFLSIWAGGAHSGTRTSRMRSTEATGAAERGGEIFRFSCDRSRP